MLLADPGEGRLVTDYEVKIKLARRRPYRRWVEKKRIDIHGFFGDAGEIETDRELLPFRQRLFGYTRDDTDIVLDQMAAKGQEPTGSVGADTQRAVFSERPQSLFSYFRQQFAQITNPPIDPIRKELVMSLMTFMGNSPNILAEKPSQARLIKLRHPVLSNGDVHRIRDLKIDDFRAVTIDAVFDAPEAGDPPGDRLPRCALERLRNEAETAVAAGARLAIGSDRGAGPARPFPPFSRRLRSTAGSPTRDSASPPASSAKPAKSGR